MTAAPLQINVEYDPVRVTGILTRGNEGDSTAWDRLRARVFVDQIEYTADQDRVELSWTDTLGLLRDFGSRAQQRSLNFRFAPSGEAAERIRQFTEEVRAARSARDRLTVQLTPADIEQAA
jgi:hypothetical protein